MESANDAAFAIAERASGSVEKFAEDANAVAKRLGAKDTTFGDPAGLDDEKLLRRGNPHERLRPRGRGPQRARRCPEIANTAKLMSYELTDPAGTARQFENHNDGFLTTYPGATGLKTGYTEAASRTLVTSATRDGRTMIAVVLATWDDTGWSGFLLDQGFATPADAPGTGENDPQVRAVTADARLRRRSRASRRARPRRRRDRRSRDRADDARRPRRPPRHRRPSAKEKTPVGDDGGTAIATTAAASTEDSGSGFSLGTIFNLRNVADLRLRACCSRCSCCAGARCGASAPAGSRGRSAWPRSGAAG